MFTKEELLAKAEQPSRDALRLHPFYKGKYQTIPKCAIRDVNDFAIWYSPGVAAPCREIAAEPKKVYQHTNKGNTIAVVSNGTRVLGLGNIGPEASLPVMEGKCLLYKYLGGVDAVPLCLSADDPEQFIQIVKALEPSFGGINLEDIAQPECFMILDRLRKEMNIPVWHDDQQGTATVILAGLMNALKLVGKKIESVTVVLSGIGAANVATYRLLKKLGLPPKQLIALDSRGTLHVGRNDIEQDQQRFPDKWIICQETNGENIQGNLQQALRGADVLIAASRPGPDTIKPEWIQQMSDQSIVFPCANPIPEIWPWEAQEAGAAVVGTGRSDFPNQINNSIAFPGIFRGVLDVNASTITDDMAIAAAREIALVAEERGLNSEYIVPAMDEVEVFPRVAAAVARQAQRENLAGLPASGEVVYQQAKRTIQQSQALSQSLQDNGFIPLPE